MEYDVVRIVSYLTLAAFGICAFIKPRQELSSYKLFISFLTIWMFLFIGSILLNSGGVRSTFFAVNLQG